jgi:hypothetical protein
VKELARPRRGWIETCPRLWQSLKFTLIIVAILGVIILLGVLAQFVHGGH